MGPTTRQHPVSLMPPSFDFAIFDFDGTLSETWHLWREVDKTFFAARGLPFDEHAGQAMATLAFESAARWAIDHYHLHEDVLDICDEWNRLGAELYETQATLRPGAEAYLRALRDKGVSLALATTNDPTVLAAMAPRVQVSELFDVIVCGREVARGKDHPDIYLEAAHRLGADPRDCMVFEDVAAGLRAAASVGMTTVGVVSKDPRQSVEDLTGAANVLIKGWEGLV